VKSEQQLGFLYGAYAVSALPVPLARAGGAGPASVPLESPA